ncbi:GtrA family protein [Curtobacterium sp. VKM Ac-2865]|uniref:GtrA family protein n=1 Tax=Curtobacterium sp. VKM Ac-2865 TaxID=2783817 RepID=UPI00188D1C40|nr:GtrA family protein [Curtobacterium sp. VKM Ac-2865]MBF4583389.1 GtrA family protein [Curtobacterium sp. VKM Ac-2865]
MVILILMDALLRLFRRYPSAGRFLVVGGIGFLLTMAINYGLKLFVIPQHPVSALVIGTVVATVVSYWLNKKWSFGDRGGRHTGLEMLYFVIVSAIGIALNSAPLYLSRYAFGLEVPHVSRATQEIADFVSGPVIGTAIAMVFRYWAMSRWVFVRRADV